jgi:hypothetical protein
MYSELIRALHSSMYANIDAMYLCYSRVLDRHWSDQASVRRRLCVLSQALLRAKGDCAISISKSRCASCGVAGC